MRLKFSAAPSGDCHKVLAKGASLADYDWPPEASQPVNQSASQSARQPFSRDRKEVYFVQLNAFLFARRVSGPKPQISPTNELKENRFWNKANRLA